MYQLLARLYGNNNLPDSSNMCHETTSVALPQSIGVPVGTVRLDDSSIRLYLLFRPERRDELAASAARSAESPPAKRRSWFSIPCASAVEAFVNPQQPVEIGDELADRDRHAISAGARPVTCRHDGIAKALLAYEAEAQAGRRAAVLDRGFIEEHTHGFEAFEAQVHATAWTDIIEASGLPRDALEKAAETFARAKNIVAIYGMGLTQHRLGVETVQLLVNLLLMRGMMGKTGAGICPIRGHSNVQGQRTVGIAEKTELVPLDRLAEQYGFEPPREDGMNTVEACEGIVDGTVRAFIGLGGNFVRAIPERDLMEERWRGLELSVQIATKLNRGHLITAGDLSAADPVRSKSTRRHRVRRSSRWRTPPRASTPRAASTIRRASISCRSRQSSPELQGNAIPQREGAVG